MPDRCYFKLVMNKVKVYATFLPMPKYSNDGNNNNDDDIILIIISITVQNMCFVMTPGVIFVLLCEVD